MKLSYDIEHTLAILIGTGNYLTEDFMQIKPVKGNLEDLRRLLLDKDIFGLPEERIVLLEDKTHLEILKTLKLELGKSNLKTVIIYYSGHGHRTSKDRLFLTASNSEKDFDLIKGTAIEFTDFKNIIENSPGKPISIIIIDACYSGIAAQSENTLTDEERSIKGACIITSSSNKEQSFFDENAKHTFFTDELIEILGKGSEKSEECLSINDIYENLQNQLRSKNISEPQRRDNLDSGVFFFARNKKFNKEFFIHKAEEHFNRGNYSRALEYYFTLKDKFNDTDFSSQIKKCREEIDYAGLIDEGESLYYNKDYEPALNKFKEAQKIKSESLLLLKIKKCEYEIKLETEVLKRIEEKRSLDQEKLRLEKEKAELERSEAEELRQKQEEELNQKQEEELKRKYEDELRIKQEEEFKQKHEAELKRKQEEELRRKHEDELKKKQEDELKQKQEDELKRIQLDELKRKHGEELIRMHEDELKKKQEEELKQKQEVELKRMQEEELKQKQEEEHRGLPLEELKKLHGEELRTAQEEYLRIKKVKELKSKFEYNKPSTNPIQKYWWTTFVRSILFFFLGGIFVIDEGLYLASGLFGLLLLFNGILLLVGKSNFTADIKSYRIFGGIFNILIGLLSFIVPDFLLFFIWVFISGIYHLLYGIKLKGILNNECLDISRLEVFIGIITLSFGIWSLILFQTSTFRIMIAITWCYAVVSSILMIILSVKLKKFKPSI